MFDPSRIPHVFRASSARSAERQCVSTGFATLDEALVGGWPAPALIELLIDVYGVGELQLVVPLLQTLLRRPPQPPLVIWLNPPYSPNAVALVQHGLAAQHWLATDLSARDLLWSAEQALRARACSAVMIWAKSASTPALRRLKLAAMNTNSIGVLYRPLHEAQQPSPATLRLALRADPRGLRVEILKNEGRKPAQLVIDVSNVHPRITR
jgi:protein ImuA